MENQMTTNWYLQLIKGIVMILLAILVFMSPAGALFAWAVYIGIGMILSGILNIILGFSVRGVLENWGWRVFEGFMDIFIGFIFMANPAVTAAVLPFVISFWGSFYGIMLFVDAFSSKGNTGIKMVSGILIFLLSTTIMFNPLFVGLTLAIWFGIILFIAGIYNVIFSFSNK
jgi:uncharacterized membrane protein HdeD (DUF308 family)